MGIHSIIVIKNEKEQYLNQNEFEINGVKYKWFSYAELISNERIQKVNSDIVQFVREFGI